MFDPLATVKPAIAFLGALALVVLGLIMVPMTVQAVGMPVSLTCSYPTAAFDPGYGVSQLAVTPACILATR